MNHNMMFLAELHKENKPHANYGQWNGYVQHIATQVQHIIFFLLSLLPPMDVSHKYHNLDITNRP